MVVICTVDIEFGGVICSARLVFNDTRVVSLIMMSNRLYSELTRSLSVRKNYSICSRINSFPIEVPLDVERHITLTDRTHCNNHFLVIYWFRAEIEGHNLRCNYRKCKISIRFRNKKQNLCHAKIPVVLFNTIATHDVSPHGF